MLAVGVGLILMAKYHSVKCADVGIGSWFDCHGQVSYINVCVCVCVRVRVRVRAGGTVNLTMTATAWPGRRQRRLCCCGKTSQDAPWQWTPRAMWFLLVTPLQSFFCGNSE